MEEETEEWVKASLNPVNANADECTQHMRLCPLFTWVSIPTICSSVALGLCQ